jgi:hypothetical protein
MDTYRAYIVEEEKIFKNFAEFKAKNDDLALRKARSLVSVHPVELWEGSRLIGTFVPVIRPMSMAV